jgi:hypothetical protein
MKLSKLMLVSALAVAVSFTAATHAASPSTSGFVLAQAMVPPTGMMDAMKPTPMEQRYLDRYPQSAQVGDLIGLPVLDLNASTLGYVQQIVRTPQNKVEFIVSYSPWWGWFGRPVAVPLEVLGIEGKQFVSLDMPPKNYAKAPTWQADGGMALPIDAMVKVALARN